MTEIIHFPLIGGGQVVDVEVIERKPDGTIRGSMKYQGQTWPVQITEPREGCQVLHFATEPDHDGFYVSKTFTATTDMIAQLRPEISGAGASCPPAGSRPGPLSPDRQRAVDSLAEPARRRREIIASITEPLRVTAGRLFEAAKITRAVAAMDPEIVVLGGGEVCRFCGLPPRLWHAEDCAWRLANILYPEHHDDVRNTPR